MDILVYELFSFDSRLLATMVFQPFILATNRLAFPPPCMV
jgi:hypothetical protein